MQLRYPWYFAEFDGDEMGKARIKEVLRMAHAYVSGGQYRARCYNARRRVIEVGTDLATKRDSAEWEPAEYEEQEEDDGALSLEDWDWSGDGSMIDTPSPSASQVLDPKSAVWDFLASCKPSMTHLYGPLLDFGCVDDKYLGAMMAWPAPVVWDVLQRFGEWPGNGGRMRQMDAEVLWYHLTCARDGDSP